MLQYTLAANETERVSFLGSNPLYVAHGPPFICSKGSPTGGNANEGKNGKGVAVGTATCIVHPT